VSESGQETSGPAEKPGRYQRSFGGLIGSMIVLVVAVLAVVVFREVFRDTPEVKPEAVDYLPLVGALQDAGRQVAYPAKLPDDWMVTTVETLPGERPSWRLGLLTDDGSFLGVVQQDEDVDDLVAEHIDEDASEDGTTELASAVGASWERFSDEGGDHGLATQVTTDVGEESLLVYGSAPVADLEALVGLLTFDPVPAS
jgi:hypothetical protein